jgi:hypothetical protein
MRSGVDFLVLTRKRAHELEDAPSHLRVPYAHECKAQLQSFATRKELHHRRRLISVCKAHRRRAGIDIFVEEADGNAENPRDFEQAPRTDAINSFFVFLNLLKCETEQIPETFLTHSDQHAPQSNAMTDMRVDRIGLFLGHSLKPFLRCLI